jgi:dipeptidyl aminopeptidase/acylaminoacyl peptidase
LEEKKGETSSGFPFSLPDGKGFLFNMGLSDGSRGIELASLGSMNRKLVLPGVTSAPIVAPAPNGKTYLLYLHEASLTAQEFDEKSATVRGSPFLLVDGIGRVSATAALPAVGVSQNGILAYQTGVEAQASRLGWFNRSGKSLKELPPSAGALDPRFSPDGRFVAMRKRSGAGSDIWLMDLTRGSSTRFTFGNNGANYLGLIWSPDGKHIAYGLAGGGMYAKDPNGTGAEQKLLNSFGRPLSWSPDGRQILFEALGGRLFLVPLEGGKAPVPIGPAAGASGADISPDGKYFAVTSGESGRDEVYIEAMPPATGKWQISINGGGQPRWRTDGKELFFLSLDLKMMAVDIQSGQGIAAGVPHVLFQTGASSFASPDYDVSSDGQSFLIALPASNAVDAPITVVLNWWAGLKSGAAGE